ncbi:hypothetical protein [Hyalangium minutum]|uniref:hypothetical protein n=1 Tax=Hyalangium minutum TaxID=394096 RepID=UPI0005C6347E|nr:hypothetical protein [Hyalangium minutum]
MPNSENYKEYQTLGSTVQVTLDGFGSFTLLASKILLECGLGEMDTDGVGMAKLDPEKWYPLDAFLRAFDRVQAEFGDYTLKQSGLYIVKKASQPGDFLTGIARAFETLDMGYHYNHAKSGKRMFDPQTGQMLEGIGHYKVRTVPGKTQVFVDADTPYPCAFEEGLVTGLGQQFNAGAKVMHDPKTCRKKGAPACTYSITWK